jgi:hypothetical protein
MLDNYPPSGTRVRFVREVKKAKIASVATLKRPLSEKRTYPESAEDEFIVTIPGEDIIVKRADIEKI